MKKVILITGANGMLAKHLGKKLEPQYSVRFLTRNVTQNNEYLWDLKKNYIDPKALIDVDSIIHLAGSSIADKRWTKERKEIILSSRVDGAHLILTELIKNNLTIDSFISASAIGYYGTTTTQEIFTEESPKGNDYLSDVCNKWEDAAHTFKLNNVANRVSIVRIGIILAENDGALKKMIQPIQYGIGSGIGTGNQYVPWIHIEDLSAIFMFLLINKDMSGTFNGVSPEHITNIELTKKIAATINRKIFLPNIPKFFFQALFGEMAVILLEGSRVSSDKVIKNGFNFKYQEFSHALDNILKQ